MPRAEAFRSANAVFTVGSVCGSPRKCSKRNPYSSTLHIGVEGMQPRQHLFLETRFVHQALERRSGVQHLRVVCRPRLCFEHRPQSALYIRLLFPHGVFRQRSEQWKHNGLAVRVSVLQDLDHLAHQVRIGRCRRVEVQDSALAAFVHVADGLPHLGVRVFRQIQEQRG